MERTTFDRELRRYRVVRDSDFQGATCCPRSSAAIAATLQQQSTRAQWSSKAKVKLEGVWAAMGAELERHGDSPEEARATVDRISDVSRLRFFLPA
jgi:hypothetical protein